MKAFILAAGLGTRLKPWTLSHPKALVPVGGVPMLERVIRNLSARGFDEIMVNVHHFAGQVTDFLRERRFPEVVGVSDESGELLDTGGALVKARRFFDGSGGVLVHNVDILSNADLRGLMEEHIHAGNGCTLLVSERDSTRKLLFDEEMSLCGWHDEKSGRYRPEGFTPSASCRSYAFAGIHVVGPEAVAEMEGMFGRGAYPVMDYYLSARRKVRVRGTVGPGLRLLDIGKPENLAWAGDWVNGAGGSSIRSGGLS